MPYTNLEMIRKLLSDDYKLDFNEQVADGYSTIYRLSNERIKADSLTVTVDNGLLSEDTDYTVDYERGILTFTVAPAVEKNIVSRYEHSTFSDTELANFYDELQNNNQVVLRCIDILLFDSSRRFDYSSGQAEMKPDQVFRHLKELRAILVNKIKDEGQQESAAKYGGTVAVVGKYNKDYVTEEKTTDLSRFDE